MNLIKLVEYCLFVNVHLLYRTVSKQKRINRSLSTISKLPIVRNVFYFLFFNNRKFGPKFQINSHFQIEVIP